MHESEVRCDTLWWDIGGIRVPILSKPLSELTFYNHRKRDHMPSLALIVHMVLQ
ncbi:MAG: hypothetical protein IPP71_12940 [Bacteroidetes bacterium]|nr:hypothetical protein [Bacteroidota bacterium]